MSIRTTAAAVKAIFPTTMTEAEIAPFMEAASLMVTDLIAGDSAVTSTGMELVERWLAAHFACMWDRQSQSEGAGGSLSFAGQHTMGLNYTRYGQQAILLDSTGALADAAAAAESPRRTTTVKSIHKTPSTW